MKIQLPDYVEILNTRDKSNNLKTLRYKDKFLHSPYNPLLEAERELSEYNIDDYKVFVIFGFGMGYILDVLRDKIKSNKVKIIIVEYEKSFQYFIDQKETGDITFLFNIDIEKVVKKIFSIIKNISMKNVLFLEINSLMDINISYYNEIQKQIKVFYQQKVANITTTAYYSEQWLFNSFINIKNLKNVYLINEYQKKFKGVQGLLVSSGPSLEDDVEYIKEFKGVIFSLPPSVNFLLKNNIRPDYIILGDSNYYNHYHLRQAFGFNIPILIDVSIHYTILSKWKGPLIIFSYNTPGLEFFFKKYSIDYIPQGGTVACTALSAMSYMGIRDVILSGQDFAYKDVKLHVKGSGYEKYHLNRINKFTSICKMNYELIKDNKFEFIEDKIIDHKLKLYKDWFYKLVHYLKINIETKDKILSGFKIKIDVNKLSDISLKKDFEDIMEKFNKIEFYMNKDINDFIEYIIKDEMLYNLLNSFAPQQFLKIKQKHEIDNDEFFLEIKNAINKIKWLAAYNLRDS